jgi:hypothetical protein
MRLVLAFLAAAALPAQTITGPLAVSDRWPEATDLVAWTRDVMRLEGVANASQTAQGKAFFRWLRLFNRMATGGMIQAYEGEHGQERYVTDAHKNLFVYGWGYCDTTSRIAEAAWVEYRHDRETAERVCVMHDNGGYHTMYRLLLDGRYAAFDPRYGYYLVAGDSPDARVLDWDEVGVDDNIRRNKTFTHRSAPFFEFFGQEWERAFLIQPAYHRTEQEWVKAGKPVEVVFGNRQYRMGTPFHDMNFHLPPGSAVERFWDNSARKFYAPAGKHTHREEAFLPSGRFYRVTEAMLDGNWPKYDPNYEKAKPYLERVPLDEGYNEQVRGGRTIGQAWGRFTHEPPAGELSPAERVFDYYVPYVLVDGRLTGAAETVEFRTLRAKATRRDEPDAWSAWDTVHQGPGKFSVELGRPRFDGRRVSIHGVYRFQVRVRGANAYRLETWFENNIMSLPRIFAGKNRVRFQVQDASQLRGPVEVIYRYRTAEGTQEHRRRIDPKEFRYNSAFYEIDAPGLVRCDSVAVRY